MRDRELVKGKGVKKMVLILIMVSGLCYAQTDLVFPWVTNNAFQSKIVINNLGGADAEVTLTASRAAGNDPLQEISEPIIIAAFSQVSLSASDLFKELGEGSGYSVKLISDSNQIQGSFIVRSGSSPGQTNVIPADEAASKILFNLMNIGDGFSSPVVVNMGSEEADVTFHAFKYGQKLVGSVTRKVPAGLPHAELASELFDRAEGDIYVVAESNQPLVGVAFVFNDNREPSMANAQPIEALPADLFGLRPPAPAKAEGQHRIFFELVVLNPPGKTYRMTRIETYDGEALISTYTSSALNAIRTTFPIGDVAFLTETFEGALPEKLNHLVTIKPLGEEAFVKEYETPLSQTPTISLGPPLKGDRWLAVNVLSNDTGHRRAITVGEEGALIINQRFAIDWVQVDPSFQSTFSGNSRENNSYFCYGAEAIAVADGVVMQLGDGVEENIPGVIPPYTNQVALAGNYVILDIGDGHYAFYAHLQPGSIKVSIGQRVSKGETLGLVGNSGNSSEPHLHFHLNTQSRFQSEDAPYGIEHFFRSQNGSDWESVEDELPTNFQFVRFSEESKGKYFPASPPPVSGKLRRQLTHLEPHTHRPIEK